MFLIVGLGNPGKEYDNTPHNMGFMALDEFAKANEFPPFKLSKKHSSLISEGILGLAKVVLVKPQTFMNNSGKAVKALLPKLSLGTPKLSLGRQELVVIHDDIDIPLGKVKVSKGSGSAGHKGVGSIIQSLGTKDFIRIRIGIQPERGKPANVEEFVLRPFQKSELPLLQSALQNAIQALAKLSS
ncbi:MAG: aminoacyl-tRNA hydrolase [bacterium]|nr:aminoacyl-tRNA hydrolase [bacterium]